MSTSNPNAPFEADAFAWNIAPVCDAFPGTADPAGYVVQRYRRGLMGFRLQGHYRLDTANELAALLNTDSRHPRLSALKIRETHL